ncbi:MAG: hypothetical protein MAG431_01869 [Chloroflexi bacterium]|nr:hypothetical protein [Chloroflexota bacterium]
MPQDVLDMEKIEQLKMVMGEDAAEVIGDLIDTLLDSGKSQMKAIKEALAEGDLETVKLKAHTLKGSSGNMGARELSDTCSEMEKRAEKGELRGARALQDTLFSDFEQAMLALK